MNKKAKTTILFKRKKGVVLFLIWIGMLSQSVIMNAKPIKGTVVDETGDPLPGVTVQIQGSTAGVITDLDGNFSIEANSNTQLNISFLGYQTATVKVNEQSELFVKLVPKTNELDEVTVVAFAKQKKESVIGSITTVKPSELKVPSSNLTTALSGRIAGLVSYQRSGEPGMDNASFFVRGVTSLTYATGPLILIDGVEMSSSDLARISPDDIASFSIMKDATATALYGARGANGVIIITTKEGKEGKTTVSFRVETSVSTPTQKVKLADPITYMQLNNEAILTRNPDANPIYGPEQIENTMDPNRNSYIYPANDWYSMLFNDQALNYRANLNLSGGANVARYYIAASYTQDQGVLKVDKKNNFNNNIDSRHYLLRTNVNINLTKSTEAVVRLSGRFDDYTGPIDGGSALYQKVMRSDPVSFPAYYAPDATYTGTKHILFGNGSNIGSGSTNRYINPYADMVKGYKDYTTSQMSAQFELRQKLDFILPGLLIRGLFNTNRYSYYEVTRSYDPYYYSIGSYDKYTDQYTLKSINNGTEYLGYKVGSRDINSTNYGEAAISYDQVFSKKHAVSQLFVTTIRNYIESGGDDFQLSLPHRNAGLSGRTTYAFDNRYFSEFNFGYNGSERFAKKERFGFFPSAGLGWIVSNETFWTGILEKMMPKLKLKATYGLVGNDAIGNAKHRFYYLSNVNMDAGGKGYTFGNDFTYYRNGVSISRYENPLITWETSKKLNLGLEMNLFSDLDINLDYYTEHRSGILLNRIDIPATMGFQAEQQANLGKAMGSGIDLSFDYQHYFSNTFWLTGRANFTYAKTKYTEYEETDNTLTPWLSKVGQPVSQRWGLIAERLFVDDEEVLNSPSQSLYGHYAGGDIKYKDINGDDVINELDMVPIGYPTEPQIVYGFGLSAGYKNFDFSFFFQGIAQESFWLNTKIRYNDGDAPSTVPFINSDRRDNSIISKNALLQAYADSHWSESDKNIYALWPRLDDTMNDNNFSQLNTWFMRDGSFLRLKSVELGYKIPRRLINKIGMKEFRAYLSGTNLLTFSKFKLWDPEMAGNGLGYPVQRVFNIGLQITF